MWGGRGAAPLHLWFDNSDIHVTVKLHRDPPSAPTYSDARI
jgi:hypothetical protein